MMARTITNTRSKTTERKNAVKSKERYGYRVLGKGIFINNDTRETHLNNNDLICGASGSSKTGSVVYTQLKTVSDSSLVVVDTKNRLSSMFTAELKKKGYDVLTLDFIGIELVNLSLMIIKILVHYLIGRHILLPLGYRGVIFQHHSPLEGSVDVLELVDLIIL